MRNTEPHYDEDQYLEERYGEDEIELKDDRYKRKRSFKKSFKAQDEYYTPSILGLIIHFIKKTS